MLSRHAPDPREWAQRDLEARFAVADLFAGLGLTSELTDHVLFGPETGLDVCSCTRCRYFQEQDRR
jgi:hypothetical protein